MHLNHFLTPNCLRTKYNNRNLLALVLLTILVFSIPNISYSQENKAEQTWELPEIKNSAVDIKTEANYSEVNDTIPIRGTQYMIRVPENWNGILLNDLDYLQSANSKRNLHLLEKGYALSGTNVAQKDFRIMTLHTKSMILFRYSIFLKKHSESQNM